MRARTVLPGVALFAGLLAFFVALHYNCLYDDAFTYLRYVRNFRAGCGVRWNCDAPPVEGFSSPLHFVLLVLVSLFGTKLVLVSQIVGTLTTFGASFVAIASATESSRRRPIATTASRHSIPARLR